MTDAVIEVFGDVFTDIDAIGGLTMGGDPMAYGVAAVAATRGHACAASASARKRNRAGSPAVSPAPSSRRPGARHRGHDHARDIADRGCRRGGGFGAVPVWMTVIVDRGGTCAAMAAEAGHRLPPPAHRPRPRLRLRHLIVVGSGSASETPGLRMPSGSSACLTARCAARSAGDRIKSSHGALATPMPCSAEIVPPRSATAGRTVSARRVGVGRAEKVEVGVAFGQMAERDQPGSVVGRGRLRDGEQSASEPRGTATSSLNVGCRSLVASERSPR